MGRGDAKPWAGDREDHAADAGQPPLPRCSSGQRAAPGDRPSALGAPFHLPQGVESILWSGPECHLQTRPANQCLPPDPRPPGAVPRLHRDLVVGGPVSPCRIYSSVQFSRSVVSDSLRPHELQHARPPCPSSTPRVHSDSRPLSQ